MCYRADDDDGAGTHGSIGRSELRTIDKSYRRKSVRVRRTSGGIQNYAPDFKTARGAASKATLYSYFGNESQGEHTRVYLDAVKHGDGKYNCFLHHKGRLLKQEVGINATKASAFARLYMGMEAQGYETCVYRTGSFR